MNNVLGGLLAFAGLGVLLVVRQFLLYPFRPTDWKIAFASEYNAERHALQAARRERIRVEKGHAEKAAAARAPITEINSRRKRDVETRNAKIARLRREEDGEVIEQVGRLRLHEHALVFLAENDSSESQEASPRIEESVRLGRIEVSFKPGRQYTYIEVEGPDGTSSAAAYPHSQYDERKIHRFAQRISNRAKAERGELARKEEEIRELETEIGQIHTTADAAEQQARKAYQDLLKAQQEDEERIRALAAWDEACKVWKEMAGYRPGWWWRW